MAPRTTTRRSGNGRPTSQAVLDQALQRRSVFEDIRAKAWPYRYEVELHLHNIVGGVPSNPKVIEGWIKTKLATDRDDLIRDMVAATLVERALDKPSEQLDPAAMEKAIEDAALLKHLNGFIRDTLPNGRLTPCVQGRHVKAMIDLVTP